MKIRGESREMKTISPKYSTPKKGFSLKMEYPKARLNRSANISYTIRNLCLIRCRKMGMNPKMQRLMYRRVKTFEVLLSREDSKIDAKNMALIDVGFPRKTSAEESDCFLTWV